jgi:hypothetical protein
MSLMAHMLAALPGSKLHPEPLRIFTRLLKGLEVKSLDKKDMSSMLKDLAICGKKAGQHELMAPHLLELIEQLTKSIDFLTDNEILLIIEAHQHLRANQNDLISLIRKTFMNMINKYEEMDQNQIRMYVRYLDAFSQSGLGRFNARDQLKIGEALGYFIGKSRGTFSDHHRIQAVENTLNGKLTREARKPILQALAEIDAPWAVNLQFPHDSELFRASLTRMLPTINGYVRLVYVMCHELSRKNTPPNVAEYLATHRAAFEADIRDKPYAFAPLFKTSYRAVREQSSTLIERVFESDSSDNNKANTALPMVVTP